MKNRILHVMVADDKFTLPLMKYLLTELKLENHRFLVIGERYDPAYKSPFIARIKIPNRLYFLSNIFTFMREVYKADIIIAHAAPESIFFLLTPQKIKNVIWVIQGGIDIPLSNKPNSLREYLNLIFKRKIKSHTTHIQEDSDIVNRTLGINSDFKYSPCYLSNTFTNIKDESEFVYTKGFSQKKILLGNSTDPRNNHIEALEIVQKSCIEPTMIKSILSYGIFESYKENVISVGEKMFGQKFNPVTKFMPLGEYLNLLNSIDYVIFNHKRQEAMGVTIQLLSLAKPIFFNPQSPAYQSLIRRGYVVFNIYELEKFKDIKSVDLRKNRELLLKEYSLEVLNSFYTNL
jgi:dTDP-N-acetylfucosamine:lipid II N-acetylfucosaminyltransferase